MDKLAISGSPSCQFWAAYLITQGLCGQTEVIVHCRYLLADARVEAGEGGGV